MLVNFQAPDSFLENSGAPSQFDSVFDSSSETTEPLLYSKRKPEPIYGGSQRCATAEPIYVHQRSVAAVPSSSAPEPIYVERRAATAEPIYVQRRHKECTVAAEPLYGRRTVPSEPMYGLRRAEQPVFTARVQPNVAVEPMYAATRLEITEPVYAKRSEVVTNNDELIYAKRPPMTAIEPLYTEKPNNSDKPANFPIDEAVRLLQESVQQQ